jgi:hypothetical protein
MPNKVVMHIGHRLDIDYSAMVLEMLYDWV